MTQKEADRLREDHKKTKAENDLLNRKNAELEARLFEVQNQLAWLNRQVFGQKRERFVPACDGQLNLFAPPEPLVSQEQNQQITYTRQKPKKEPVKGHARQFLPEHLRRVVEVIEPENLAVDAKRIGQDVTELLCYKPGEIYVRRIVRPKYSQLKEGEENQAIKETTVVIAPMPSKPIPKGNADASLLAFLSVSKYVDHLPIYRVRQMLARMGYEVAETTLIGWIMASAELLRPLYDVLGRKILESRYVMSDETHIKVLDKNKKGSTHMGYYWVACSPPENLVYFGYDPGRSSRFPANFFKKYQGALQTDGYSAYDQIGLWPGITHLSCMAHVRRYFTEAQANAPDKANHVLLKIQELYAIERQARENNMSVDERFNLRQEAAIPVLKELKEWMDEQANIVLPKSPIGRAIAYAQGQWTKLVRYCENGLWEIDNNMVENAIRPVAIGRKNYLFAGSHESAQSAAVIYSLVCSCKKQGIDPLTWLTHTLTVISDHKANRLEELLPGYLAPQTNP